MDRGSSFAKDIDNYNKRNKADVQLRKCLKCMNFDKSIYRCKLKKCINERSE